MLKLKPSHVYPFLAFVTGFAIMSYELVAARLLAPSIGSSMYVWTGVIGVIIVAMAAGYAVGGVLADQRVRPLDVAWLLLACAATVVLTILFAMEVPAVVAATFGDARMQAFVAALLLFSPTSFLIAAISPYLARLKNQSLATTGTTIASLSALNSLGGIAGTFCTGFVFFAFMGTRQTLLLIGLLLVVGSWLVSPRDELRKRVIASFLIGLLAFLSIASVKAMGLVATIDTPSSSYQVVNRLYQGRPIRALVSGPGGMQSGIYLDGSEELAFSYTQKMAELVALAPRPDDILVLGGGTFTLPQYLATKYPDSQVDVVEIDPELLPVARQYFSYRDPANVNIQFDDARTFINHNQKQYDIVLVDAYSDTLVPFTLTTAEYTAGLKRAVRPDGVVIANIIGAATPACRDLLGGIHASYRQYLPSFQLYPLLDRTLQVEQNIIAAYSGSPQTWLPEGDGPGELPPALVFTDEFAPVEYLQQRCHASQ